MLKRIFIVTCLGLSVGSVSFAATNITDALSLAGTYICNGYDKQEGSYNGAKLVITLDAKNSDFSNNYGAYKAIGGSGYIIEIAASGNSYAYYYRSAKPSKVDDHGVGTGVVIHDKDAQGNVSTEMHTFFYVPNYKGGDTVYETCVKQANS